MSFSEVLQSEQRLRHETVRNHEVRMPMSERDEWYVFLRRHFSPNLHIVDELATHYEQRKGQTLPLPKTTFEGNELTLEWNSPRLYLEVEISDGEVQWFFRDSEKRETAEGQRADHKLLDHIARFEACA